MRARGVESRGSHVTTLVRRRAGGQSRRSPPARTIGTRHQNPYTGPTTKNVARPSVLLKPCARTGAQTVPK